MHTVNCLDTVVEGRMNTSKETTTYLCPIHKILQHGNKRITFEKELYEAIVNSSMELTQLLYKSVIHGCHCQANYIQFNKVMGPKASEQTMQ